MSPQSLPPATPFSQMLPAQPAQKCHRRHSIEHFDGPIGDTPLANQRLKQTKIPTECAADADQPHWHLYDMQEQAEQAPIDDGEDSDAPSTESLGSMLDEEEELLYAYLANSGPTDKPIPNALEEVLLGPHAAQWEEAMQSEYQSLVDNNVFTVVPLLEGIKPITSKAVLTVKFDADGNIE